LPNEDLDPVHIRHRLTALTHHPGENRHRADAIIRDRLSYHVDGVGPRGAPNAHLGSSVRTIDAFDVWEISPVNTLRSLAFDPRHSMRRN